MYLDGDFEMLQSFQPLLMACDLFAGINYAKEFELANGLIGSIAHHPILFFAQASARFFC